MNDIFLLSNPELDKNIINDEKDLYRLSFYKVDFNIIKKIGISIGNKNIQAFRIEDDKYFDEEKGILDYPDVIVLPKDEKIPLEIMEKILKLKKQKNISVYYVSKEDVNDNNLPSTINQIKFEMYKGKTLKYRNIQKRKLEDMVENQEQQNPSDLEKTTSNIINNIFKMFKQKDETTFKHIVGVVNLIPIMLAGMDEGELTLNEIHDLKIASALHDVGKLMTPNQILKKARRLNDQEFEIIKMHSLEEYSLLDCDFLKKYIDISLLHHTRYDGKGYQKISGENIPKLSRIISILDAFEVMTGDRNYVQKNQKSLNEIKKDLIENKGKQFDPHLVDCFIKGLEKNKRFEQEYHNKYLKNLKQRYDTTIDQKEKEQLRIKILENIYVTKNQDNSMIGGKKIG